MSIFFVVEVILQNIMDTEDSIIYNKNKYISIIKGNHDG